MDDANPHMRACTHTPPTRESVSVSMETLLLKAVCLQGSTMISNGLEGLP